MNAFAADLIWVIVFRAAQTGIDSIPTILCGLFVAGLMRSMIGPAALRRWFADDPVIGLLRIWLAGSLLPVCSFGAMPIAWELKRAGVPRAVVMTFLLSAPLINPLSLIDAFQRLEGHGAWALTAIGFLIVASLVLTAGLGIAWARLFPEPRLAADLPRLPTSSRRRLAVLSLTAARGLMGDFLIYFFVGIMGSGLLAVVSGGALEQVINERTLMAPLHVAGVTIPLQTPPSRGMTFVCESLFCGIALGRIFELFLFGIGLHLGTLVWVGCTYGIRGIAWLMVVITGTIAVGFSLPVSVPISTLETTRECHFLEIEAQGGQQVAKARLVRTTLTDDAGRPQFFMIAACGLFATLWVIGLVSTFFGDRASLTAIMQAGTAQTTDNETTTLGQTLTTPQQASAGTVVAIGLMIAGFYLYYPPAREVLDQIDGVEHELIRLMKVEPFPRRAALQLIAHEKRLQRKLPISILLRRGSIAGPLRTKTAELGAAGDRLRAAIVAGESEDNLKSLLDQSREILREFRETLERGR